MPDDSSQLQSTTAPTAFAPSPVEVHSIDTTHSEVSFQVRHLLTRVRGRFRDFAGRIELRPDDLASSSVRFAIRAESIDTDLPDRDSHLRSEDFLWTERYPDIVFESTRVEVIERDRFRVVGDLSLRGVTREIELAVDYLGSVTDPWGNSKAGFSTETILDRKDFGIIWNMALDQGGVVLGDRIRIAINLESLALSEESAR